jgi:hypothetical protein
MPLLLQEDKGNYPAGTKTIWVEIVAKADLNEVATAYIEPLNKTVVVKSKGGLNRDYVNVNRNVGGKVTNRGPGSIEVTYE